MEEVTPRSRQQKAADTRTKIYSSAALLFQQKGFDAVSVDDIVRLASVAKGSFYVHFRSKDELITLYIDAFIRRVDTDYDDYLKNLPPNLSTGEVLLAFAGKIAEILTDAVGCENMRNLYRAMLSNDTRTHGVADYNRDLYALFNRILLTGIGKGDFRPDLSAVDVAKHFVNAYRGLTLEWCVRYPDYDLKKQAQDHFKLLLIGISTPSK